VCFQNTERPYQPHKDRFKYEEITRDVSQVIIKSGFREIPNLTKVIHHLRDIEALDPEEEISVFISKASPTRSKSPVLSPFSEHVYIFLASIAQNATEFYRIPPHKVIEFGMKYKI
jgi:KUP system potassium uptake protein